MFHEPGHEGGIQALAIPVRVTALRAMPGRLTALATDLITFYDRNDPARHGEAGASLHDPCIITCLLRPDLFGTRGAYVTVGLKSGLG